MTKVIKNTDGTYTKYETSHTLCGPVVLLNTKKIISEEELTEEDREELEKESD